MRDAGTRVWRYEFGYGVTGSGKPPEHTTEMDYVHHARPSKVGQNDWPPVQRYWVNFIHNGDPNGEGLPTWPIVSGLDGSLGITPRSTTAMHRARAALCDLMFQGLDHPPSTAVLN